MHEELKKVLLLEQDCFSDIIGQENTKEALRSALLSNRHVIIAGAPGIGKTTLAKNVARLLPEIVVNDCSYNCSPERPVCPVCKQMKRLGQKRVRGEERFVRVQGSPDLTAEDLLGDIDPMKALKFGPTSIQAFTPGKVFRANNGLLFFDELNRCPEKLQNALLQILEEGKATIGNYSVDFEADFILIATMNPKDSSTERLSDVFIDRFDIIHMGYPETTEIESKIVKLKGKHLCEFPQELFGFMIEFVRVLRNSKKLEKLPSVRASLGLYERAQATALIRRKEQVDFEDLRDVVVSVLAHRISLNASTKYLVSSEEFVESEFRRFCEEHSRVSKKKGGYR